MTIAFNVGISNDIKWCSLLAETTEDHKKAVFVVIGAWNIDIKLTIHESESSASFAKQYRSSSQISIEKI